MNTTAGSTSYDDAQLARRLPPDLLHTVLAYEDELERLRAAQPDPAHARRCRTDKIEALVLLALSNATLLSDVMAVNHAFRVDKVVKHLNYYKEDHGNTKKRYDIEKAPSRAKIREVMVKHGFML
ncbi:hypothetical protein ACIQUS_23140 [Pseudomonas sp. NPDC090755]|uniref:hypothetical protein n=1 Tax=Pseudomonas sp. NPDC090755 TaxID=3364481 RepID=UPI00383B4ED0